MVFKYPRICFRWWYFRFISIKKHSIYLAEIETYNLTPILVISCAIPERSAIQSFLIDMYVLQTMIMK